MSSYGKFSLKIYNGLRVHIYRGALSLIMKIMNVHAELIVIDALQFCAKNKSYFMTLQLVLLDIVINII